MRIFDTHAHYDSEQFDEDREEMLEEINKPFPGTACSSDRGEFVSVGRIVNVGADMESSQTSIELAQKHEFIYAAVGVHPDSAEELIRCTIPANEENIKLLSENECEANRCLLNELSNRNKVVAIGEIGLDYHWDVWPREIQKEAFRWQWNLALEKKLPVIIHSRDAAEDTMNIVREFYRKVESLKVNSQASGDTAESTSPMCGTGGGMKQMADINCYNTGHPLKDDKSIVLRAVMHCYSYSAEQAEEYLKMGLMFGIGGVVTFKNARKLKEVVDLLPMDRILLETDCPYMAPEPFRGKRNNSGYLRYVAEKIAEIKGIDAEEVYDITYKNACGFFGMEKGYDV